MIKSKKIAVIIPAYNEAKVISSVVKNIPRQIKVGPNSWELSVIVVDDGSSDATADQALKAGAYVIKHILNTGSGGATATGMRYAEKSGYQIAATIDADGQHDTQDLIKGLQESLNSDVDLLIGSRLINAGGMPKIKIFGNKGLSFITYLLFGVNVTDSQSGMRVYSNKALRQLRWRTSGYEFCSEMLWRAKQQNLKIGEYPIKAIYTEYSTGKGQNNWNAFNIVRSLFKRRLMEFFSE